MQTDPGFTLLVTALSGGLAGALLTQVVGWFGRYWMRPILEVGLNSTIPGCVATTPALRDRDGERTVGLQQSFRVQVRNAGRTTAQSVNVCATEISFSPAKGQKTIHFGEEVVDLLMSLSGRTELGLAQSHFVLLMFSTPSNSALRFHPVSPLQYIRCA